MRASESTKTGLLPSVGRPWAGEYVTKVLSRILSSPRALPIHRLPSRSSNTAVTAPREGASLSFMTATPWELRRSSPRESVPNHKLRSRSRAMDRTWKCPNEAGMPAESNSLPFQCSIPSSVPIQRL